MIIIFIIWTYFYEIIKMKKSRLVCIVIGLVCLFGLMDRVNCRREQAYIPQEIKIERQKLADGYRIVQTRPVRRVFEHHSDTDIEWLEDLDNNGYYIDHDCNGLDTIYENGWYHIGYPNTEKMFENKNRYFENAKEEMNELIRLNEKEK